MCTDLVAREQSMCEECRDLKRCSGQRCSGEVGRAGSWRALWATMNLCLYYENNHITGVVRHP